MGLYLGSMVGQYCGFWTVFAVVDSIWTIHPLMRDKSARPPPRRARQRFLHNAVSGETAAQGSEAAKGRWQAGRCASCWSDGLADANGARGGARCVSAAPAGGLTARMLGESLEFVLVNVCAIL